VAQRRALRAIERCRTAALGEHRDRCTVCGYRPVSFNSCRNRHCNKCQAQARERWLQARARELLAVSYIHVVFTLPHALLPLSYRNAALLYTLLFRASAATLLTVAAAPLGARIGFLSILHTWGQPRQASARPRRRAAGASADRRRRVRPNIPASSCPSRCCAACFRGKLWGPAPRLRGRPPRQPAPPHPRDPAQWRTFVNTLFETDWVVPSLPWRRAGRAAGTGALYHRVAMGNHG
jgi:hypothetical protein